MGVLSLHCETISNTFGLVHSDNSDIFVAHTSSPVGGCLRGSRKNPITLPCRDVDRSKGEPTSLWIWRAPWQSRLDRDDMRYLCENLDSL